jgi:predicted metal-dependent enzyme (double-stranded beta helix superfamily)
LVSGDFNGDVRVDLLAHSDQKYRHQLMHADANGNMTVVVQINANVKWCKNRAVQMVVTDFNGDGRDDIFALAKQQNKKHYVVYKDEQGQLLAQNTQAINPKIANDYNVVAANVDGDKLLELVKLADMSGGIDENGDVHE